MQVLIYNPSSTARALDIVLDANSGRSLRGLVPGCGTIDVGKEVDPWELQHNLQFMTEQRAGKWQVSFGGETGDFMPVGGLPPVGSPGLVLTSDAVGGAAWAALAGGGALLQRQLGGQDRDDVSFGAWPVAAPAELNADSILTTLTVHRFDDTTEEGAGLGEYLIPTGATTMTLTFEHRAQTAPGAAQAVRPKLYWKSHGDNAAYGATANTLLTTLAIPASTAWQIDSQTIALTTLGLTVGDIVQLELTRVGTDAADTLAGDWTLSISGVRFD